MTKTERLYMKFKALILTTLFSATLAPLAISAMHRQKPTKTELENQYRNVVNQPRFNNLSKEEKEELVQECVEAELNPQIHNNIKDTSKDHTIRF